MIDEAQIKILKAQKLRQDTKLKYSINYSINSQKYHDINSLVKKQQLAILNLFPSLMDDE